MSEQEATTVEAPKAKLSVMLRSIGQLLMSGQFPGTHAQIIVQGIGVLEILAAAEEKKELEAEEAAKPKLEIVEDSGTSILGETILDEEPVNVQTEFKAGGGAKPKIDRPTKVIPAFTVMRVDGGWAFVRMTVDQDFNTLSAEVSQPDLKSIITERFRLEVGKYWGKLDEQVI